MRPIPEFQMLKDFPNGGRLLNEGDDLHPASAGTGQGIDLIDFPDQPCPTFPALSVKALGWRAGFDGGIGRVLLRGSGRHLSSFSSRGVRVAAIVADRLLMRIGNVGSNQSNPVEGIHGPLDSLFGLVLDLSQICLVIQSSGSKTGTEDIGTETVQRLFVFRRDRSSHPDLKAGVMPQAEFVGKLRAEAVFPDKHFQDVMLEKLGQTG